MRHAQGAASCLNEREAWRRHRGAGRVGHPLTEAGATERAESSHLVDNFV